MIIKGLLHRKVIKGKMILLALTLFSFNALAQDISQVPLTWSVTHMLDQNSQENVSYSCSFKTNGSQDITWLQKGGAHSTTLAVQSIEGSWAEISRTGQAIFNVTSEGQNGSIKFERTTSGLFITLNLSRGQGRLRQQLTVSQITPN